MSRAWYNEGNMQYNSDSDSQDIVSLVGDMTGIDTTNEIKQITRACNEANKKIWSWIFESFGGWQYDDNNNTDLPKATTTLTADQQLYSLPSDALTIKSVEYKNSGGDWVKLKPLTIAQLNQFTSEKEWQDTSAEPQWYAPLSDHIKLYPASDTTRSGGLRVQFDRGSVNFASTDIEQDPGFASEFHGAVAVGAAYVIGISKKLPNWELIRAEWLDAERRIKEFYIKRWEEKFPPRFETEDTLQRYI